MLFLSYLLSFQKSGGFANYLFFYSKFILCSTNILSKMLSAQTSDSNRAFCMIVGCLVTIINNVVQICSQLIFLGWYPCDWWSRKRFNVAYQFNAEIKYYIIYLFWLIFELCWDIFIYLSTCILMLGRFGFPHYQLKGRLYSQQAQIRHQRRLLFEQLFQFHYQQHNSMFHDLPFSVCVSGFIWKKFILVTWLICYI